MEPYLSAAAIVAVVVGLVHSVLGERLIFGKLRSTGLVPTEPAPPLQSRHVRILWATWHLTSVFGFVMAALLFTRAAGPANQMADAVVLPALTGAFAGGSALVLVATRGGHPGWIGLLAVAVLVGLAMVGADP